MRANQWIVRQVYRDACLVALLLHQLGVLIGLDEPFVELPIPRKKLLILSFEFATSIDGQFRFGPDLESTLQQRCDADERWGFECTSQSVV